MTFAFPAVLPLRVMLRAAEAQRLPPFLGSALHGTLARALYKTVCGFPKRTTCPGCPLYARCAYPALFETPATASDILRTAGIRDHAPRPLVVAPEPGWTRASGNSIHLASQETVPFRLTLIGRAIDDLPIVTVALQHAARCGLGIPDGTEAATVEPTRRRAALALASVCTADGVHVVYAAAQDAFAPPLGPAQGGGIAGDDITIELVSPLRLKHNGKLVSLVTPSTFFAALARRTNALAILHADGKPVADEARVAALAESIAADGTKLRHVPVPRYSARQRTRMQWPGLMGTLHWRGAALRELGRLLRFGELVQVGKGTARGFGRYELRGP